MKVKKILVSQPEPANLEKSPYSDLITKYKLGVDFNKFIKIEGIEAKEFRQDRVKIQDHTAVILTSRQAVDHFFRISKEMRVEIPDSMKYFCISESTAYYLQKYVQYRKRKIFHGKQSFADLLEIIKKHKSETFLLPCSEVHKPELPKLLEKSNLNFSKAVIYRTKAADLSHLDIDSYDMLVFFSPSGVQSLFDNFPDYKQGDSFIAGFGPATSKAIKASGLELNINAPTKTAPSMTMAIEQFLLENK